MALGVDLGLHRELEPGVVGIVVAAAANLKNDAGVAFVAKRYDGPDPLGPVGYVFAAGAVTGFTAHPSQVGVIRYGGADGKSAVAAEAGGVAAHAVRVALLRRLGEPPPGVGVGARGPGGVLGLVTALAGFGADVGDLAGQQVLVGRSPFGQQLLLLRQGELCHVVERGVGDPGQEAVVFETERVLGVVTGHAGRPELPGGYETRR